MSHDPIALEALNAAPADAFATGLGDIFEHAPSVAEQAASARPFATVEALHTAMFAQVSQAPRAEQLAFVRKHPRLAVKPATLSTLTAFSNSEQGSAGLDRLNEEEFRRFSELNDAYENRFGFPFVICVRRHTRRSILSEFARRLAAEPDEEIAEALRQIGFITRLRLAARVSGPGLPAVNGRLTTHVLDTSIGRPAAGVQIELRDISDGAPGVLMRSEKTNVDGRTDQPLIAAQPLRMGDYELSFHVGAFFRREGRVQEAGAFLDVVPVRFSIAEPEAHYHVPLLVTPWSYATYRGS